MLFVWRGQLMGDRNDCDFGRRDPDSTKSCLKLSLQFFYHQVKDVPASCGTAAPKKKHKKKKKHHSDGGGSGGAVQTDLASPDGGGFFKHGLAKWNPIKTGGYTIETILSSVWGPQLMHLIACKPKARNYCACTPVVGEIIMLTFSFIKKFCGSWQPARIKHTKNIHR